MRNASTWWIIAVIMLLLDFYVYQAFKTITQTTGDRTRIALQVGYWLVSAATLLLLMSFLTYRLCRLPKYSAIMYSPFWSGYFLQIIGIPVFYAG